MNARYFDVDNFVITAKNIEGPWSERFICTLPDLMHRSCMMMMEIYCLT